MLIGEISTLRDMQIATIVHIDSKTTKVLVLSTLTGLAGERTTPLHTNPSQSAPRIRVSISLIRQLALRDATASRYCYPPCTDLRLY